MAAWNGRTHAVYEFVQFWLERQVPEADLRQALVAIADAIISAANGGQPVNLKPLPSFDSFELWITKERERVNQALIAQRQLAGKRRKTGYVYANGRVR